MPSLHLWMKFSAKESLPAIPSSHILPIAMQSNFPLSKPLAGIDAASCFDNPAPHLNSFPASLDGKMQLPAGSFSPYITPPNSDTRTQTHREKACFPQMESGVTLTSKCGKQYSCYRIVPEKLIGNRASTTKRMCFVGDFNFATDLADCQGACGETTVCRRSEFTQKRTQAARGVELTTTRDSLCASSDVAKTISPPTALSPYSGFHRMLHRGDNGIHVEQSSVGARFTK